MSANRTRRSLTAGLTCVGALRRTSPHATSFLFRSGLAPRPLQTRGYAQPASNPDQDDGSVRHGAESDPQNSASDAGPSRRGGMSAEDKAKWAFPSKPNPSPYDILHLPKTASKSEIKQNCECDTSGWKSTDHADPSLCRLSISNDLPSGRKSSILLDRQLYGTPKRL
jgi:hypothetical protein